MATVSKKKKNKATKKQPVSFRFDETTAWHIRVLGSYYRRNFTVVLTRLIEAEFERLQKADPAELKKAEEFAQD